ncbi:MAG: hypothetical protein F4W93_01420 [Dehalococcoidia bacterium]|nr:hypothetical protein [Dehalococcoidia bacterium]
MNNDNQEKRGQAVRPRDQDFVGAEAAMRRASFIARRRAIETSGSYAVYRDGKIVHVTEIPGLYDDEPVEN